MNRTMGPPGGRTTCGKCSRPVQMVKVAGDMVAVDPEVVMVVPSGRLGEVIAAPATVPGRRLHAALCDGYQLQDEKERHRRELAAYNRANPRKTRSL